MQVAGKLVGIININALDRARQFTLGQMKAADDSRQHGGRRARERFALRTGAAG